MFLAYKHTEHEDEEERHRGGGFELFPNLQAAQIDVRMSTAAPPRLLGAGLTRSQQPFIEMHKQDARFVVLAEALRAGISPGPGRPRYTFWRAYLSDRVPTRRVPTPLP
jgi:hypothetical protein